MTILVIDDEKSIRISLTLGLQKLKAQILSAENGYDGIELFKQNKIDLVILDIKLPDITGIEVLKQLKHLDQNCTVIMMTHLSEVRLAVQAMKLGAHDYFTKPFSLEEMISVIEQLDGYIKDKSSIIEVETSEQQMIGDSEAINAIHQKNREIGKANINTCVLITGESGTGKELIAKRIHEVCRPDAPFVAINCAAIPKHLQESELFGHEKGAFSDAKNQRVGLLEYAREGVLFLDEVGDMDLDLQAKLLRVLQERKFRRIGGNMEYTFDAMVVAATNKALMDEIEKGQFRKDLYYRLNVIPIKLPALRERQGDVLLLVNHFIAHYNERLGKHVSGMTPELLKVLNQYSWPGNIRELKNIIERLMILNDAALLTVDELPYELTDMENEERFNSELTHLEQAEQEAVLRALSQFNWNITRAAEALQISRLTLRRKIDKYGIANKER